MLQIPDIAPVPRVLALGLMTAGPRWRMSAMRALREPLLLWFTQGQGRITVAGITRGFGPHNAVFIPAGTMHGFDPVARCQGYAVHFGSADGLELSPRPFHLRVRDAAPQREITQAIEQILRECEALRPGCARAVRHQLGLLSVTLERLMIESGQTDAPPRSSAARLATRYAALLERDFHSDFGVADYAAALGVTPTHLTRICRSSCGRTAHALLIDRRLFEARRLLADTRLPVKTVAQLTGFATPAYFTRSFQQHTGMTPTSFRRGSASGGDGVQGSVTPPAEQRDSTLQHRAQRSGSDWSDRGTAAGNRRL